MNELNPPVSHAQINWDTDGQPVSSTFGDVYFSRANGLEETRHVFLHHNQLAERWSSLNSSDHFTIGETGFGSGLNFLAAWELWLNTAPQNAQLHFVSVEKFPLTKTDLIRALSLWPELHALSQLLLESYPEMVGESVHRLNFMSGRIKLTLIIGDAAAGFTQLLASSHPLFEREGFKIDAWFLDGFAPSKNPQMWSDRLFENINKLSRLSTTAATFSAAAIVKNGLKNAGFSIEKVAGFGRKREMIKAILQSEGSTPNPEDFTFRGSFSPYPIPWSIQRNKPCIKTKTALIIGGGLAGCHSARALAERGWQVTIIERHSNLAQEGSGNPQGALYAKLSPDEETQAAFNFACLYYALNFYRPLWSLIGAECGLLQLAHNESEKNLQQQLIQKFSQAADLVQFVDAQKASELAGTSLHESGIYFPQAGWINPSKLCTYLVNHNNIQCIYDFNVTRLIEHNNTWQAQNQEGESYSAEVAIIASAKDAQQFEQANHLPIKSIRGQVTYFPQTKRSPILKTVVCAAGYISPADAGIFCTGATFDTKCLEKNLRLSDHESNLFNLQKHLPAFDMPTDLNELRGRVAFRCALPDYLPAVGALPQLQDFIEDYAPLRKNARAGITQAGNYWKGLYINIGHGARGLAYTPLCAEILAALINNECPPVNQELVNSLNPARFIIRDLIRSKR